MVGGKVAMDRRKFFLPLDVNCNEPQAQLLTLSLCVLPNCNVLYQGCQQLHFNPPTSNAPALNSVLSRVVAYSSLCRLFAFHASEQAVTRPEPEFWLNELAFCNR
jgi:hypothetical protein